MEMTVDLIQVIKIGIPIIILVGGWIYGYGKLNSRIDNMQKRINQISELADQVKEISKTLNQLVGKVDLFFSTFCKDINK